MPIFKKLKSWLIAYRPLAQTTLLFPLLLGQLQHPSISITRLIYIHLWGLLLHGAIIFTNEWADVDADRKNIKPSPFSGGSQMINRGILTKREMSKAAKIFSALSILSILPTLFISPLIPILAITGNILFWAYSCPPIKINYRGGGEILQTIGVATILPLVGFLTQGGNLPDLPLQILPPLILTQLASAITSTIPDEEGDIGGGKRTLTTILGAKRSAILVILLQASALALVETLSIHYIALAILTLSYFFKSRAAMMIFCGTSLLIVILVIFSLFPAI